MTGKNRRLKYAHLFADDLFIFTSAPETSVSNLVDRHGPIIPQRLWSLSDFQRSIFPKTSPGKKVWSRNYGDVGLLYPA